MEIVEKSPQIFPTFSHETRHSGIITDRYVSNWISMSVIVRIYVSLPSDFQIFFNFCKNI